MVHKLYAGQDGAAPAAETAGPAPASDLKEALSQLSHDLRTPLGVVIGYTDLLLDGAEGSLSGEQRRHLRQIRQGGQRMLDILNRCLRQVEDRC